MKNLVCTYVCMCLYTCVQSVRQESSRPRELHCASHPTFSEMLSSLHFSIYMTLWEGFSTLPPVESHLNEFIPCDQKVEMIQMLILINTDMPRMHYSSPCVILEAAEDRMLCRSMVPWLYVVSLCPDEKPFPGCCSTLHF